MTPRGQAGRWLGEAIATHDLERLKPSMSAAGDKVNTARGHVRSARSLADDDPTLALAACHDAIRKAISGHMRAMGYRPRGGEGAHRVVLEYARHELADAIEGDDLLDADAIRKDRRLAEYGEFASTQIDGDHVRWAADIAERIVNAVAAELAAQSTPPS